MALDSGLLQSELLSKVIANTHYEPSQTRAEQFQEAGRRWADAYGTYAAAASSCATIIDTEVLPLQQQAMAGSLASAFQAAQDAASAATALVTGLGLFWANPLLWKIIPPIFPVTLVVPGGAVALQPLLVAAFAANAVGRPTHAQVAQQFASLLDAYTTAVVVTHGVVPGPGCAAPIF
ncbi:MAG: hypothetical protein ACREO9_03690 [Lysobacterales bacterium]